MKRSYIQYVLKYINRKITLVSGPRQCGKTTFSKMLDQNYDYLNYDTEEDREIIREKSWDRKKSHIIFDEIHKMKNWKRWIKGIFDTEGIPPSITITGSAMLDTYKKVGDSLAGRYFQYRFHPFDIRELHQVDSAINISDTIERLLRVGGFPEPYIENDIIFYNKWKKTHLDIILKQDLLMRDDVKDIRSMELLIELLQKSVGSTISYTSLARDLQCSDKTVKKWLGVLEEMYIVFKITPYHKNIARSNLKQPKYYFYDNARVKNNEGASLENLVATSLLKQCQFRQDCLGEEVNLFYLAKNGGKEIDFAIQVNEQLKYMIEVKNSDSSLSPNFNLFAKDLPETKCVQLVKNLKREKTFSNGAEIREVGNFLCSWE